MGGCEMLIALTIIVAIIIIILTPDSTVAIGAVIALLGFLAVLGAKRPPDSNSVNVGKRPHCAPPRGRKTQNQGCGGRMPPRPTCRTSHMPKSPQGAPMGSTVWRHSSDPSAVFEAEALDVVGGGREYRDYREGFCGCSAAEAEMLPNVGGPPDPDWDRLAAGAEAEGLSLAQGGGGPSGPGAYVRGSEFTVPGYRPGGVTAARDSFSPLPGGHNPYAVFSAWGETGPPGGEALEGGAPAPYDRAKVPLGSPFGTAYAGAIEAEQRDVDTPGAWAQGHHDRQAVTDYDVIDGNPFDVSRIASPQAAGACFDDEANDAEADVDEQNVNQVRSRNDETRVIAGIMNRTKWLTPYLKEELDEYENLNWWGRNEL